MERFVGESNANLHVPTGQLHLHPSLEIFACPHDECIRPGRFFEVELFDMLDKADEIRLGLFESADAEACGPVNLDVHRAVIIGVDLEDSDQRSDEMRVGRATDFGAAADENNTKRTIFAKTIVNKLAVSVFKHMKPHGHVREEHRADREQGQFF